MNITIIATAFLLGLAYCAPPGAVFAETLRRGMAESDRLRAMRTAWRVQIGSVVGDMAWAALAMTGAAVLVQNQTARIALGALGVLLMAWLSSAALRDAWRGGAPIANADARIGSFRIGMLLALGNPFAVPFWLGLGAGGLTQLDTTPSAFDAVAFFAAFIAATIVYAAVVALLVGFGRRLLNARTYRVINASCGLFLAWKSIELAAALITVGSG